MGRFRSRPHLPRTRRGWLLSSLAALVAAVGIAYGAFAILAGGSSPAALSLNSSTSGSQSPAPPAIGHIAGSWTVGPGSVAGYRVHEKLAVLPAPSDAVGRTSNITGQATVTQTGTTHTVTAASFTVQVNTLASDRAMRDQRVHTLGLQTDTYPTAAFQLAQPVTLPADAGSGAVVKVTATGPLTMHGVTRTVSIPLSVRLSGSTFEVVGAISFPWSEFGMSAPNFGNFVTVADTATMEMDLKFTRAA
ncbi:MAG TPA: YceI family protein [Candidatus Dormibacteraeota bacterium]|jgi:polyisoprenoid-binding protein YceI